MSTIERHLAPRAVIDWTTLPRAAREIGTSLPLLEEAVMAGEIQVQIACGKPIVRRSQVFEWAALLKMALNHLQEPCTKAEPCKNEAAQHGIVQGAKGSWEDRRG